MKKPQKVAAAVMLIGAFLLVSVSWYFSSRILYPRYYCDLPKYIHCETPAEMGLTYEAVRLKTTDSIELEAWFVPSKQAEASKAVVFVHGHGGVIQEGLRYAPALHEAGYHLMFFSLRGNMPEGGMPFYSMGYHERKDLRAAVDYVANRDGVQSIAVFGISMGAVTAISGMAEDSRIAAGIFNSPFKNAEDQFGDLAWRDYKLPHYPLLPVVVALSQWRSQADFDEVAAEHRIAEISPRPVFVMHGKGDTYVQVHHGQTVFGAAKAPKQSWFSDSPDHVYEWNWNREEAERRVLTFLRENL